MIIWYHGCAYMYFVHLKGLLKSCSLISPLILFGKFLSILGNRSKIFFKVHFNPNYSWILYIQSHTSCKHRTGWELSPNSSSALSSAINRRLCLQSRIKSLLSAGLLLLADSPQDFSAPHEVGTGSLTKMLLSTPWCCKEMREEGKNASRVYSQVEGVGATELRALASQVFLFYSPLKMRCADTWKWDARSQNVLLGLGFHFSVLYWYCKQISHSWDNNNDHELHLKLLMYPSGNPQNCLIPKFTFSVSSLNTCRRCLWIQMLQITSLPKVWKGTL